MKEQFDDLDYLVSLSWYEFIPKIECLKNEEYFDISIWKNSFSFNPTESDNINVRVYRNIKLKSYDLVVMNKDIVNFLLSKSPTSFHYNGTHKNWWIIIDIPWSRNVLSENYIGVIRWIIEWIYWFNSKKEKDVWISNI